MADRQLGVRGALAAWRASFNLSEIFPPRLRIVQSDDESCGLCGSPIGCAGTEARVWYRGYAHVACFDSEGFAMKGGS